MFGNSMLRTLLLIFASLTLFGADVNEELLAAARRGDLASVKTSIEKGAAIETKTSYGQTPLYLAAMSGHQDVVDFLLAKGANVNVSDTFYKAPMLAFVLQRKHYGIAKELIAKGGGSPDEVLASVAGSGNTDLLQAALEKKPSQSALDKAYEVALDRKQAAVAELLQKAGAQQPTPAVEVDSKVLESYAGVYKSEQLPIDIKVFLKEGKLYLQGTGQPEIALKARSPTIFEFARARLEVEFDSASSFTFKQGGTSYRFKKAVTP
jgi:Ankyrin repeats (3 copies)